MMGHKKYLLAGSVLLSAAAHADYRAEVSLSYTSEDGSHKSHISIPGYYFESSKVKFEDTETELQGDIYFDNVSTKKGPFAWAPFLSKSSGVSLNISNEELSTKGDGAESSDADTTLLSLHYVVPSSNLILNAGAGKTDSDEMDGTVFLLGFGAYLTPESTLEIAYLKSDYDNVDDDADAWMVGYTALLPMQGSQYLSLEPSFATYDAFGFSSTELAIELGWYFNKQLGVTGKYTRGSGDDDYEADDFEFGVQYFVNENFSAGISYVTSSSEYQPEDYLNLKSDKDGYRLQLSGRF